MPTTTKGVTAALTSQVAQAHQDPMAAPVNSAAITLYAANPTFAEIHMRTSGRKEKKEIPYKEGILKNIGAHGGVYSPILEG